MKGSIHLSRVVLVSANPEQLARFYVEALGFEIENTDNAPHALLLTLGGQQLAIESFDPPGALYPPRISGMNTLFQHFAIVVSDIDEAYQKLRPHSSWMPISLLGPERLPESSGGVSAYKFRDPEGHPLELIAFPANRTPEAWKFSGGRVFMGIDHSAISVTDTQKSVLFYKSLGLTVGAGSLNKGSEQVRLDAIRDVAVEVTSLMLPDDSTPHVELLCYGMSSDDEPQVQNMRPEINDIAATRLVFSVKDAHALVDICSNHEDAVLIGPRADGSPATHALLRDPDGHLLQFDVDMD